MTDLDVAVLLHDEKTLEVARWRADVERLEDVGRPGDQHRIQRGDLRKSVETNDSCDETNDGSFFHEMILEASRFRREASPVYDIAPRTGKDPRVTRRVVLTPERSESSDSFGHDFGSCRE